MVNRKKLCLDLIFYRDFFEKHKVSFGLMVNKIVFGWDSLSHHCTNLSNRTCTLFNGNIQMWAHSFYDVSEEGSLETVLYVLQTEENVKVRPPHPLLPDPPLYKSPSRSWIRAPALLQPTRRWSCTGTCCCSGTWPPSARRRGPTSRSSRPAPSPAQVLHHCHLVQFPPVIGCRPNHSTGNGYLTDPV